MSDKIVSLAPSVNRWSLFMLNIADWNRRRLAKIELRSMSDYLLRDIGMPRAEINAYVDGVTSEYRTTAEILELSISRPTVVALSTQRAKAA
jgi:uncharacterized protein YjiS (DUF1127 family)